MTVSPYHAMQAAVEIVNTSQHATNKIAASLFGTTADGSSFMVSAINHWPEAIAKKIGTTLRIGGCSGTVHAETACILQAPITLGASLCITDPFCPNCAKNIVEAGIKTIYIDHKGFAKDFAQRRGDDFSSMSLRIVERAGITVYSINRKEQTISPLLQSPIGYTPPEDRPIHCVTPSTNTFNSDALIDQTRRFRPDMPKLPFAAGWAMGYDHRPKILIAESHIITGYTETSTADRQEIESRFDTKYTFTMEPVNRLIIGAARLGMKLDNRMIISSRVPTSREQVNMIAAGLIHLKILNPQSMRDVAAINALHQLVQAGIIVLV